MKLLMFLHKKIGNAISSLYQSLFRVVTNVEGIGNLTSKFFKCKLYLGIREKIVSQYATKFTTASVSFAKDR